MKHLARTTLTLSVLALLAAIWLQPWWAFLLTGVLLLLVGAAIGGQTTQPGPEPERRTITDHDVQNYRAQHGRPQYGRKADDK